MTVRCWIINSTQNVQERPSVDINAVITQEHGHPMQQQFVRFLCKINIL